MDCQIVGWRGREEREAVGLGVPLPVRELIRGGCRRECSQEAPLEPNIEHYGASA